MHAFTQVFRRFHHWSAALVFLVGAGGYFALAQLAGGSSGKQTNAMAVANVAALETSASDSSLAVASLELAPEAALSATGLETVPLVAGKIEEPETMQDRAASNVPSAESTAATQPELALDAATMEELWRLAEAASIDALPESPASPTFEAAYTSQPATFFSETQSQWARPTLWGGAGSGPLAYLGGGGSGGGNFPGGSSGGPGPGGTTPVSNPPPSDVTPPNPPVDPTDTNPPPSDPPQDDLPPTIPPDDKNGPINPPVVDLPIVNPPNDYPGPNDDVARVPDQTSTLGLLAGSALFWVGVRRLRSRRAR